jgi:glycosidase
LKGVDQNLDYLRSLANTLYLIRYLMQARIIPATHSYYKVDPYFGTQKDWENLVKHANQLGIRIVLDGVFNHMSSDSPLFDRYHHYDTVGACESLDSPYRGWFVFRNNNVPCGAADYEGWFGFDSIPVLKKDNPDVQAYFLTAEDSILSKLAAPWCCRLAAGCLLAHCFPGWYWETFRQVTRELSLTPC